MATLPRCVGVSALFVAAIAISACGIRVPQVDYRLQPLVTTPVGLPATVDGRDDFADLFCATLAHAPGAWGPFDQYLEAAGASRSVLGELRTDYRLLVVPGIFGQCIDPLAKAFADASAHLEHTHGIKTDYVSVSATGGTAFNVAQIAEYLKKHFTSGVGPYYVAFGYSKGASDLLAALGRYPVVQEAVKGFVSVAGTVSGSRLADGVPDNILEFLAGDTFGPCDFGDGEGINSLRRQPRIEALLRTTLPSSLRTYSVTATSTWETTSRVLQNGWRTLSAYSIDQDSQVIRSDGILPGSVYLGTVRADHWAVALPLEDVGSRLIDIFVDQNHFPRVALVESAFRFVLRDFR